MNTRSDKAMQELWIKASPGLSIQPSYKPHKRVELSAEKSDKDDKRPERGGKELPSLG